jgi:hypothetical protein
MPAIGRVPPYARNIVESIYSAHARTTTLKLSAASAGIG